MTGTWGFAQWAAAGLLILAVVLGFAQDGKPRKNPNYSADASMAGALFWAFLLLLGGFWK